MDFGAKIRSAREDRDLSQQQVAQSIPMNQSNYSKIERNLQEPSLFQLKRIVEILGLDICELLELEPKQGGQDSAQRFVDGVLALYRELYPQK